MFNRQRFNEQNLFQLREIAFGLTFCGGFIDAYSYLERGKTLVAGQTGNIVFLSADIAARNLPGFLVRFVTLIFFILGVALATYIETRPNKNVYWRVGILVPLIIFSLIVGFIPRGVSNIFIVPPLAFGMAMQVTAFSTIEGRGYANVFSTGNLRKAVAALVRLATLKRQEELQTAIIYGCLVISFALGALSAAGLRLIFGLQTIWWATFILMGLMIFYSFLLYRRDF